MCALGSGATGALLVDPRSLVAAAVAAGAATALAAVVLSVSAASKAAALGLTGGCMVCALWLAGSPRPLIAAVPWLGAMAALLYFRTQSLETMGAPRLQPRPANRMAARA